MERIKAIFLDVDGVLNSNSTRTTTHDGWCFVDDILVERLAYIVRETGAKIVLSSTWREGWIKECEEENALFFNDLRQKLREYGIEIFDRTGEMIPGYHRGFEIDEWIKSRSDLKIENFIIIDDFGDMEPYMDHLLQTSPRTGITVEEVEIAINYLTAPTGSYDLQDREEFTFWTTNSRAYRCASCAHIYHLEEYEEDQYCYCPWCGRKIISRYDYVNLIYPARRKIKI